MPKNTYQDKLLQLEYSEKWGYYLVRGKETFYDEERYLITFETPAEAVVWAEENLGATPVEVPDEAKGEEVLEESWIKGQMKLL